MPKKHLWQKGESGNPLGRPVGIRELGTILRTELPPEMIARRLEAAIKQGNVAALLFVAERFWPKTSIVEAQVETKTVNGAHVEPFLSKEAIDAAKPKELPEDVEDGEIVH